MPDSVAYLYGMSTNIFDDMCETKEFNIGKKSTPFFDSDVEGRSCFRKDYSPKSIYYYRSESHCRESLSCLIENTKDKFEPVFRYTPSMMYTTFKFFLRLNSKNYIRSSEYDVKEFTKTLKNVLQTDKNRINVVNLGNCTIVDYYNTPTVIVTSLLSFILRDCSYFLIKNKDATTDDLINEILSGRTYGGMNYNNVYLCKNSLFNAFGLFLFIYYPQFITNYSHTVDRANGITSWVRYLIVDYRETLKRFIEFLGKYECSHLYKQLNISVTGYKNISMCGLEKEIDLLESFYFERDGKEYV